MSNISQKLDLIQSQNLVMTPQLQQAIKLLQLNNTELTEFVENELAENPLLEKDERDNEDNNNNESAATETDHVQDDFDQVWTGNESEAPQKPQNDLDAGSAAATPGSGGSHSFESAEQSFENRMSRESTLREHLEEQIHMAFSDTRDRMIGALLTDQMDESGYIRLDSAELAARLDCTEERIEKLLSRMKQFDPTGICARDLSECLALQLDELGQLDKPMQTLLNNIDMLANHDFDGLAKKCDVNETYLHDMIAEIRTLISTILSSRPQYPTC